MNERVVVGLHIGSDEITAVRVQNGTVTAFSSEQILNEEMLASAVKSCLLAVKPASRWTRTRCEVALGAGRVQVRRIAGIPVVASRRSALAMIQTSVGEYFLGARGALDVAVGGQEEDGSLWAFACDASLRQAIHEVVSSVEFTLHRFRPAVDLLATLPLAGGGQLSVPDGARAVAHVSVKDGLIARTWRTNASAVDHAYVGLPADAIAAFALQIPATEHHRYLVPWLATQHNCRGRFLSTMTAELSATQPSPARLWAWGTAAAVFTIAALATPLVRSRASAARSSAGISPLAARYSIVSSRARTVDSASLVTAEIHRFRSGGAHALAVLTNIATALPEDAVVTSLSADSTSVQASLLASSAADLIESLGRMRSVDSLTLVGAVTREPLGRGRSAELGFPTTTARMPEAVVMERISVRFRSDRLAIVTDSSATVRRLSPQPRAAAVASASVDGEGRFP